MSRARARDDASVADVALAPRARLRAGLYNASNTCYLNAILQARPTTRSRRRARSRRAGAPTRRDGGGDDDDDRRADD